MSSQIDNPLLRTKQSIKLSQKGRPIADVSVSALLMLSRQVAASNLVSRTNSIPSTALVLLYRLYRALESIPIVKIYLLEKYEEFKKLFLKKLKVRDVRTIQCTCECLKFQIFSNISVLSSLVLLFEIESEFEFAGSVDESTTIPFFISTVIPSECVL